MTPTTTDYQTFIRMKADFFQSVLKDRVTILGGEYRLRAARQRGPLFIEAPLSQKWAQSWKSVLDLCFEEKKTKKKKNHKLHEQTKQQSTLTWLTRPLFMVHTLDSIAQGFP